MTASATVNAKGTVVQVGDGATPTEAFTDIGNITDVGDINETTKAIDVTTLVDDYVQKDGGAPIDSGDLTLDLLYDPAQELPAVGSKKNYKILLSDGLSGFSFAAVNTGIKRMPKKGDKLRAQVKLDISGAVTPITLG